MRVAAVFFACALSLVATTASAVTVALWETAAGPTVAGTTDASGVTVNNLAGGASAEGVVTSTITPVAGSTFKWENYTPSNSTRAEAQASGEIWTWGISSTEAYDFTELKINLASGSAGPTFYSIELSINGGEFFDITNPGDSPIAQGGSDALTIDLADVNNVNDATFRLTAWDPSNNGPNGTLELINQTLDDGTVFGILLLGEVATIPLPASAWLLLSGIFGLGALRLRRT